MPTLPPPKNAVVAILLVLSGAAIIQNADAFDFQSEMQMARNIRDNGQNELFIPIHTYHIRSAYDPAKIAEFNETPWGLGFGRGIHDDDGHWRGLYAMAFQDSHRNIQPIAGYGYLAQFASVDQVHASIGFTTFITAREDIHHYMPLPGILPMAALEYKKATLMMTYLPGHHNNGNVLFFLAKIDLPK